MDGYHLIVQKESKDSPKISDEKDADTDQIGSHSDVTSTLTDIRRYHKAVSSKALGETG